MAVLRNMARQEQVLAEAQRKLERIERMREEMAKQVELEMQRLNELREVSEKFVQDASTIPSLSSAASTSFQSQYDQFNTSKNNERLKPIGNDGAFDFTGKLQSPKDDVSFYRTNDRDEHWTHLDENPGKPIFVSGRYVSSEHGNNAINSNKEYEYELSIRALPVSVGDMLTVPVHPTGHDDGKAYTTGHLQLMVTDIYSTPKFHRYHDRIDG